MFSRSVHHLFNIFLLSLLTKYELLFILQFINYYVIVKKVMVRTIDPCHRSSCLLVDIAQPVAV